MGTQDDDPRGDDRAPIDGEVVQEQERGPAATGEAQHKGLSVIEPPRFPWDPAIGQQYATSLKVDKQSWRALIDAIFPTARSAESVMMALAYCRSRSLDVWKRPVHIVPMWSEAQGRMIETVWPGIAEIRTTAVRTGQYAGNDAAEFGPWIESEFSGEAKRGGKVEKEVVKLRHPEWCRLTVYKIMGGIRVPFVGPKVVWKETYATKSRWTDVPNSMWFERAEGQIEKCAEAAALRRAFPEEIGSDYSAEEMAGRVIGTIDSARLPNLSDDQPKARVNALAAREDRSDPDKEPGRKNGNGATSTPKLTKTQALKQAKETAKASQPEQTEAKPETKREEAVTEIVKEASSATVQAGEGETARVEPTDAKTAPAPAQAKPKAGKAGKATPAPAEEQDNGAVYTPVVKAFQDELDAAKTGAELARAGLKFQQVLADIEQADIALWRQMDAAYKKRLEELMADEAKEQKTMNAKLAKQPWTKELAKRIDAHDERIRELAVHIWTSETREMVLKRWEEIAPQYDSLRMDHDGELSARLVLTKVRFETLGRIKGGDT